MKYTFTLPGEPRAKQRHRHTKKGSTYTPKETVKHENEVRKAFIDKYGQVMMTGAIHARITAFYGIAKSKSQKSKKEMLDGILRPTKRPDVDNIAKSILDALNDTAYKDDSQVTDLNVSKYFSYEPRVEVILIPLSTNEKE